MAPSLPAGLRARMVPGVNGLDMHVLEAGDPAHPALLLLHGFPELAYSWRKVMAPLAAAGFHVVAPDQRGYGATTGWDGAYDADNAPFRLSNLARDALALLWALGHRTAAGVAGHDFGASVAAVCALARPDAFGRLVLMSAPFAGAPQLPFGHGAGPASPDPVHAALAALPRPRKHYHQYYSSRAGFAEMDAPPQGMAAFLRAYFHQKSADWAGNRPVPLAGWTAEALADMPTYYVMDLAESMPGTVARHMPPGEAAWLTDAELSVYAEAFGRRGFGGGLHWYRCRTEGANADLELFSGRTIDVPALFVAGAQDWGVQQAPGALERMRGQACTRMEAPVSIKGAGHWVQQEQPEAVVAALLRHLRV